MTRDNDNKRDFNGNPGPNIDPVDVIKCRECGSMVRRVNNQHLQTDRCRYAYPEKVRTGNDEREDIRRDNHPETVEEYKTKYPDAPVISPRDQMELAQTNRREETDQRRKEMVKRRWYGENMTDIVSSLAQKHDVTESTIWKDWSNRDQWLPRVFDLGDAEHVVLEALAQKQDVVQRLNRLARTAETQEELDTARMALKSVGDELSDIVNMQMDLGNIDKAATKHQVEVEGDIEHRHEPVGDRLSEDTLKQLDEITDGDDEEIIDAQYEVVEDEEGDDEQ